MVRRHKGQNITGSSSRLWCVGVLPPSRLAGHFDSPKEAPSASRGARPTTARVSHVNVYMCAGWAFCLFAGCMMAIGWRLCISRIGEEKRKYGRNGKYLALVTGSLGNLSSDFSVVVELIASIQAIRASQWRTTSMRQLFSMYRRFLVSTKKKEEGEL